MRTRSPLGALALCGAFAASTPAWSQEAGCDAIYTQVSFQADTLGVQDTIDRVDLDGARRELSQIALSLVCLDSLVDPRDLAAYARLQVIVSFFTQDEAAAVRWARLEELAYAELPWPERYPETHPVRHVLDFASDPFIGGPDDQGLDAPRRGAVFMNGYLLTEPKTLAEVPAFVQIADKKGAILQNFWQDGAAFPAGLLTESAAPYPTPSWYQPWDFASEPTAVADASTTAAPPDSTHSETSMASSRSGPRWVQVGAGAGLAVVAGVLYGIGQAQLGPYDDAFGTPEQAAFRDRAAWLALGAGAAGAAAVGVGVSGFVSTDGAGLRLQGRF